MYGYIEREQRLPIEASSHAPEVEVTLVGYCSLWEMAN